MTLFFNSDQITVYRYRKLANKAQFAMSVTGTALSADIQPASDQRTEFVGGRFGATFVAFVDSYVDIKEGDQILTSSGKRYSVKGVANWSGAGLLDYKELILVSQDA